MLVHEIDVLWVPIVSAPISSDRVPSAYSDHGSHRLPAPTVSSTDPRGWVPYPCTRSDRTSPDSHFASHRARFHPAMLPHSLCHLFTIGCHRPSTSTLSKSPTSFAISPSNPIGQTHDEPSANVTPRAVEAPIVFLHEPSPSTATTHLPLAPSSLQEGTDTPVVPPWLLHRHQLPLVWATTVLISAAENLIVCRLHWRAPFSPTPEIRSLIMQESLLAPSCLANCRRVVVYDIDLVYGWSRDWENDGNTGDALIFRHVHASRRIIALHPVFLYCSWRLVLSSNCPFGGASTPHFACRGTRLQVSNRVSYNMIPIRTLSLIAYFIDIAIYTLESMPWSSRIFWLVGWVIEGPSLGLLCPCRVVPWVPIIVSSPRVLGNWVCVGWSESSLSIMNLPSTQF
jgi:hypothetical protein